MSLSHSPSIVTNGLVFYYDTANTKKSWKGAPTTNLYADGDFSSGSTHPVNGGGAVVVDPTNPSRKVIKFSPSGGNQYHGRDIPAVISTVYSLQMEVYVSSNFNGTNVMMYPEQGGAGAGVSYDLSKKGTWQTLKFNGKAATTTNIRMLAYVLSAFTTGYVLATNIQVEQNAFCTPFVNDTRSNTQAMVDMLGGQTFTPNNIVYNADGSFAFDGATSYIVGNTAVDVKTVIAWIKLGALGNDGIVYGLDANGADNWLGLAGNAVQLQVTQSADVNNSSLVGTTVLNTSQYYQIAATIDGSTAKVYCNGIQENSVTQAFTIGAWNATPYIGKRGSINQRFFSGNIASVSAYSRPLSPAEIYQNFNALRGRYGL